MVIQSLKIEPEHLKELVENGVIMIGGLKVSMDDEALLWLHSKIQGGNENKPQKAFNAQTEANFKTAMQNFLHVGKKVHDLELKVGKQEGQIAVLLETFKKSTRQKNLTKK